MTKLRESGLDHLLKDHPSLTSEQNREIGRAFLQQQDLLAKALAALGYPLERYVRAVREGRIKVFRKGTDVDVRSGEKKIGFRFGGMTPDHLGLLESYFTLFRSTRGSDREIFAKKLHTFLQNFHFAVLDELHALLGSPEGWSGSGEQGHRVAAKRAHEACLGERDKLIRGNLHLAAFVAYRAFLPLRGTQAEARFDIGDLFSAAITGGLDVAASRWDPENTTFSTYAMPWLRQAVSRSIQDNRYFYRVPIYVQNKIKNALADGQPLPADLADILPQTVSLNSSPNDEEEDSRLVESLIADEGALDPADALGESEVVLRVRAAVSALPPLQAFIMALRFGVGDPVPVSRALQAAEVTSSEARCRKLLSLVPDCDFEPPRIIMMDDQAGAYG